MSSVLGPDGCTVYPQYQIRYATTTSLGGVGQYILNISLFPNGFAPDTGGFTSDEIAEIEANLAAMVATLAEQSGVDTAPGALQLTRYDLPGTTLYPS